MYSVVITTYECQGKGVSLLKENLDAVLSQTYRPLQCVISDHSRDDAIETFVGSFDKKDVQFVYTRYPDHYGSPSHNWNNAMPYATGEYIHPIAMDERLSDPWSVQRIVDFMRTTPAQWIGIPCIHDPTGSIHVPSWNHDITRVNSIGGTGSVVIRNTLKHVKFDPQFTWVLDIDWYARLEMAGGPPAFLPLPVAYIVRLHPLQLTNLLTDTEKHKDDDAIAAKYARRSAILHQIRHEMKTDTDISGHLDTLWIKTVEMSPRKIVELGIRGGESSRIFGYAAAETGATMIGVDIVPCAYPGTFVQCDDVAYANVYKNTYGADIDVLFIDTSHFYDHTVQEIKSWFPLLSKSALVIFHDTNMQVRHTRKNGTLGDGWNNNRGVIRAIEEYFGSSFNETESFTTTVTRAGETWHISHDKFCSGLTICRRY